VSGCLAAALGCVVARAAAGAEVLPGPVPARVLSVLDGDTLIVRARIWLDLEVETRVRLEGVDAPELHGRCADERRRGRQAQSFLRETVRDPRVTLWEVHYGKFARRVVARVSTSAVPDLSAALLARGLAKAYAGGARAPWCGGTAVGSGKSRNARTPAVSPSDSAAAD